MFLESNPLKKIEGVYLAPVHPYAKGTFVPKKKHHLGSLDEEAIIQSVVPGSFIERGHIRTILTEQGEMQYKVTEYDPDSMQGTFTPDDDNQSFTGVVSL